MASLEIDKLEKRFGSVEILKGIDIALERRRASWCWSARPAAASRPCSTRSPGSRPITSGEIRIDGQRVNDLHPSKRDIAMVFQSYALYPNMTVAQNIAFGMEMRGVPKAERDKAVAEVAKTAADRAPAEPQAQPALGRPAPARRHGPGAGAQAARSSCSTSRSPTSTPSCASTCAPRSSAAPATGRHDRLRHPRPDRGDDAGHARSRC